jgi:outer membrane protein assembly factor BamB
MKPTVLALLLVIPAVPARADWPQWRGPQLTGFSPERNLPLRWSTTDNVAWSVDLPAHGASTPIVAAGKVFLSVPEGDTVNLWCLDRRDGKLLWKRPVGSSVGHANQKHNMASPSAVIDGGRVVAMTGSGALKAFDVDGRELWARDLPKEYGVFGLNWGYGSSPLLFEGGLYVQVLHGMKTDDPSYLLRLDPATGKNVWKVERTTPAIRESPDSYTTPTPVRAGGKVEIVVTGGDVVTGHDPGTGKELWRASGLNPDANPYYRIVASPVAVGDIVVAPTRVKPMLALRAGGRGDVTTTHRAWSYDQGPDVPTPATDGTYVYVVNDKGIVSCLEGKTGRVLYGPQRIALGTYSSSPTVADGKVYITNEEGLTTVLKAGPAFAVLAENSVGDFVLATPAVDGGQILLRTSKKLYCIGVPKK